MRYSLLFLLAFAPLVPAQPGADEVEAIRKAIDRVKQSADRRWEKIPWQASLVEARKTSTAEKRPIFLFTLEGNVASGRC